MFLQEKNSLTSVQTTVIITNNILSAGIIILPRTALEAGKTPDVWISVILGGLISIVLGIVMVKLSQCFPKKTFYQYSSDLLGKWVGNFLSLSMIIYFLTLSSYEVRILTEIANFFLLEGTPKWAIIMPFLWIGLYLLLGGISPLARISEVIFPITIIFFLFVLLLSFKIFEPDNLRPFMGQGILPVLKGIKSTIFTFIGAEIMLLIVSFMEEPKKGVKIIIIGIAIPIFFNLIAIIMVIGALSIDGVLHRTWPTLDLVRSYEVRGMFFERFESLLLVIWTMQFFSTFCITYFSSALGLSQIFNKKIHPFLYALLPIIYIVASIPKTLDEIFFMGDIIGKFAIIFFTLLPLPLLFIAKWKGIKNEKGL
ncbi:GerAB/ArcD/ProY family transporter [Cytobacillus dafuensis]|uniref:GerAB/ArcD/ProY family transporter n=1 Tax=Cytobacillus dafuensis TaxID=1742359 RepID=A0A5B8Z196_CYTDA|nr:GerAB/ArcD/ProY family transporter [Cytobacillus dafuensis]QED46750.1 GerAB/ArcD/ProY family transporter [Cytobacillus dafuensis]